MCTFFSFVSDGKNFYYFDSKKREEIDTNNILNYKKDSHTSIAHFFKLDEDKCNKFEYTKGKLIIDQINTKNNSKEAKEFIEKLVLTPEFEEICIHEVKKKGLALRFIKNQTDEICLAAVKKDGYALQYVKNQTEGICLAAVRHDGWALRFVKDVTEEIFVEACLWFMDNSKEK